MNFFKNIQRKLKKDIQQKVQAINYNAQIDVEDISRNMIDAIKKVDSVVDNKTKEIMTV